MVRRQLGPVCAGTTNAPRRKLMYCEGHQSRRCTSQEGLTWVVATFWIQYLPTGRVAAVESSEAWTAALLCDHISTRVGGESA